MAMITVPGPSTRPGMFPVLPVSGGKRAYSITRPRSSPAAPCRPAVATVAGCGKFCRCSKFSGDPVVNLRFHCRRFPPWPDHVGDRRSLEETALLPTPPPLRTVTLRCA
jgi:hypothetical protein